MIFKYNIGDSVLINKSSHGLVMIDMHGYFEQETKIAAQKRVYIGNNTHAPCYTLDIDDQYWIWPEECLSLVKYNSIKESDSYVLANCIKCNQPDPYATKLESHVCGICKQWNKLLAS